MSGHCRAILYTIASLSWVALGVTAIVAYGDTDIGRADLLLLVLLSAVTTVLTLSAVTVGVLCPVIIAFELGRRIERAASRWDSSADVRPSGHLRLVDDEHAG